MRFRKLKINSGTAEHYTQSITLGYKMSYDTDNGGLVPLNVLPKKLNSANLMMWQRYAAATAVMETFERQRYGTIMSTTVASRSL